MDLQDHKDDASKSRPCMHVIYMYIALLMVFLNSMLSCLAKTGSVQVLLCLIFANPVTFVVTVNKH